MAKNKKQDRKQPQSQRGPQTAQQPSSMESQAEQRITQASPADVARKGRQKRFGHN
ncbi:hypothetical protein ACWGH3_13015 [Streptomyces sp. NPDC054884]|uniref:hypothetical protein n=1 Tax=unclassified Streptomyces TaxID=2593676 RepID=UPI0029BAD0AA|nr:hypothetical protein [Streptomyces sp. ME08-AFT2]MDX3310291.1 hypothetical protein [Streptomyces sp. ME08-AFT2]